MALSEMTEDQLDDLSDEELEARVQEVRSEDIQETSDEPEETDEGKSETSIVEDIEDDTEDEPNDEVDDEIDEASESEEGQADENPETEDDETETSEPETQTQEQQFADLKVDGKMIPISSMEELYALASGGGNITQKFQKLAGHKKAISIMESQGISDSDLSILAQIKSGDKDALATLVKLSGIDYMDVTNEVAPDFNPNAHVPTDHQMSIREVQESISMDEEYSITQNVVNNMMDEQSQDALVQNPEMIRGIHEDVKSGAFQITRAQADKLKLMDGGLHSDMEYYIAAAKQQNTEPAQREPVPEVQKTVRTKASNSAKKRSAGSTRSKSLPDTRKSADDMTDEELMSYREEIMERSNY